MVLEPEILARMAISDYLRHCGYKVIEGFKPQDVFTVLNAGTPINVILSETRLASDLDGLQLAQQVRKSHPDIDVILTVGIANAADKAAQLCEDSPLEKPYHPQELVRRIHQLRERRRTAPGC